MSRSLAVALALSFVTLSAGCAADALEVLDDSADRGSELELGAADSAAGPTYYLGRFDARRCVWPICGGVWIHRANRATTRCADGHYQPECYVAEVDTSTLGLSADRASELEGRFSGGQAILTGAIATTTNGSVTYAVLRATAGWEAANDRTTDEILYALEDDGIRCFRAPCFSIDESKLSSTISRTLSDLDTSAVGLTDEQSGRIGAALAGPGLLAAGHNVRNRRTGAVTLVASQVWLPVLPAPTSCTSDADCTLTFYPTPVASEADCYCPGCPSPALAGTAAENQASWERYCSATHGIDVCPARPCAPPPPAACGIDGTCGFGRPEI